MPRRLQNERQKAAQASALGLRPWCTWIARRRALEFSFNWWSRTTESTPPERPTAISARGGSLELAMAHQPLEPHFDELFRLHLAQLLERVEQRLAQRLERRLRIAMRATERLADDLVDKAKGFQAARGDGERLGRLGRHRRIAPENGRATLGRDHRVRGVLHHLHNVAYRDGERPARSALADYGDDDGHAQARHFEQVAADGLRLAALFGVDSRVGARRVDEREYRQLELLGQLHQAQRLAVALGLGHAEVAQDLFLGVAALLMADDHAGRALEARQTAHDRGVLRVRAVAVQLFEVGEQCLNVVQCVGPLRMARDLRDLPRRELAVDVLGEGVAALGEALDFVGDIGRRVVLHKAQFLDAVLKLRDGLLELEEGRLHRAGRILPRRHGIDFDPVTTRPLACIEGTVGTLEQRADVLAWRALGHPHGNGDTPSDGNPGELRRLDRRAHALGHQSGSIHMGAGQNHQEFLAAEAPEDVDAAQPLAGDVRQFLQHRIAGGVAERVVDRLEVVDIEKADGERLAQPLRARALARQRIEHEAAVVAAGQLVADGELLDALERLAQLAVGVG